MEHSKIKISIKTPDGKKIKRTITNHTDIDDLHEQFKLFIKETEDVIKVGKNITVTCSSCCNGLSFKKCFKFKNKVKAGDVDVGIV